MSDGVLETASRGWMIAGTEGSGEQAYGEPMNDKGGGVMDSEDEGKGLTNHAGEGVAENASAAKWTCFPGMSK